MIHACVEGDRVQVDVGDNGTIILSDLLKITGIVLMGLCEDSPELLPRLLDMFRESVPTACDMARERLSGNG